MEKIFFRYRDCWKKKGFITSLLLSFLLAFLSLIFNYLSNIYTGSSLVKPVGDILLDNLPAFNVNFILNEGVSTFIFLLLFFVFIEPKRIPFFFKSMALFVFIRSIFVSLTHLGPPTGHIALDPNDWFSWLAVGNDYFFSGHTGMPFLAALIFWREKLIRYISLFFCWLFATSMLLGHLHYSIDVFAAFFITYTIFEIAKKLFTKDYRMFHEEKKL